MITNSTYFILFKTKNISDDDENKLLAKKAKLDVKSDDKTALQKRQHKSYQLAQQQSNLIVQQQNAQHRQQNKTLLGQQQNAQLRTQTSYLIPKQCNKRLGNKETFRSV